MEFGKYTVNLHKFVLDSSTPADNIGSNNIDMSAAHSFLFIPHVSKILLFIPRIGLSCHIRAIKTVQQLYNKQIYVLHRSWTGQMKR